MAGYFERSETFWTAHVLVSFMLLQLLGIAITAKMQGNKIQVPDN